MPKNNDLIDDDEPEDTPIPRNGKKAKAKPFPWLWVGIGGGGALVVLILGCGFVSMIWCGSGSWSAKVWDKEELSKKVKGKSPEEIIAMLGKPDYTSSDPKSTNGASFTYYERHKIRNTYTGKNDNVSITFWNEKAILDD